MFALLVLFVVMLLFEDTVEAAAARQGASINYGESVALMESTNDPWSTSVLVAWFVACECSCRDLAWLAGLSALINIELCLSFSFAFVLIWAAYLGECDGDDAREAWSFAEVNGSVLFAEEFSALLIVLVVCLTDECDFVGVRRPWFACAVY